jgi:hypothetical protein
MHCSGIYKFLTCFCWILLVLVCFCGKKTTQPEQSLSLCDSGATTSSTNAQRYGGYFGVGDTELISEYKTQMASFYTVYHKYPAYVLWFMQLDNNLPLDFISYCSDRSIRVVISLNIKSLSLSSLRNDTLLMEIASGKWDSTLHVLARQAKQVGTTLYLRFGYEMNGNWFSWGQKKQPFIAAWNHTHALFVRDSAVNVSWIFAPAALWSGADAQTDLLAYYPGDSVVDIVGLDGYNYGDIVKNGYQRHWTLFNGVFKTSLNAVKTLNKPIWITEAGCPTDSRRSAWLIDMFNFMDDNPCVDALLWFNAHKTGEPDFRMESDSASQAALKSWLAR